MNPSGGVIRHNNAEWPQLLGCACPVFTAPSVAGCIYVFSVPSSKYHNLGHDRFFGRPYQFNIHKTHPSALLSFLAITRLGKVRWRHSSRTHSRSFLYNMQLDLADRLWINPRHNQYLAAGLMEPQTTFWHSHLWNYCIHTDLGSTQDVWGGAMSIG